MKFCFFIASSTSIVLLLMIWGCSPQQILLTEEGKKVSLFPNPENFPKCHFTEEIRILSLSGHQNSYQQALVKLKNKTAEIGGTHVNILSSETTETSTILEGAVYQCF